jgi:phage terminase large subunit
MGRSLSISVPSVFQALLAPARYKGAHGGRGSGKSHFFALLAIIYCLARPGLRILCVREVQRSLEQSVKRLIADKIQALGLGGQFQVLDSEIRTPGGGLIVFQGMQNHTAESVKSLEGYDVAWVEEAQALSQNSLDLLRPTIRKPTPSCGSRGTRGERRTQSTRSCAVRRSRRALFVVEAGYADNPWLPDVLRADMEFDRDAIQRSTPTSGAGSTSGTARRASSRTGA